MAIDFEERGSSRASKASPRGAPGAARAASPSDGSSSRSCARPPRRAGCRSAGRARARGRRGRATPRRRWPSGPGSTGSSSTASGVRWAWRWPTPPSACSPRPTWRRPAMKALRDAGLSDESDRRGRPRVMARMATSRPRWRRVFTETSCRPATTSAPGAALRRGLPRAGADARPGARARPERAAARASSARRRRPRRLERVGCPGPADGGLLRGPVGFTRLGESLEPAELGAVAERLEADGQRGGRTAGAPDQDDRRRGDAQLARHRRAASRPPCALVEAAEEEGERLSGRCARAWPAAKRSSAPATGTAGP